MDYISDPVTAIFIAGTNSALINVSVIKDGISEGLETFDLNFTIPSSVRGVIPGNRTRAVGRIVDIESKQTYCTNCSSMAFR